MKGIHIVGGIRTPFCRVGSALKNVPAAELARIAIAELIERTGVEAGRIDHVVMGNCGNPSDAANVARVASLQAGIPRKVPAITVHRNCGSGMDAVIAAARTIATGDADIVVAGGVESMSNYPLLYPQEFAWYLDDLRRARSAWRKVRQLARFRPSLLKPRIGLLEGLTDPNCGQIMGLTAENLAREFGISRGEQDAFARRSHERALAAAANGRLAAEIAPIVPAPEYAAIAADIGPREGTTEESLGRLPPFFDRRYGTVTVGNSCQLTDGAVALLVASGKGLKRIGREPMGRLAAWGAAGLDPARMGLGPAYATPIALKKAKLTLAEIDRIEINEAFAAQVIACERAFESKRFAREELGLSKPIGTLDPARTNVNGGAISLGHPVGATGARLILTLLHELTERNLRWGLATLCVGGGQGVSVVLDRDA